MFKVQGYNKIDKTVTFISCYTLFTVHYSLPLLSVLAGKMGSFLSERLLKITLFYTSGTDLCLFRCPVFNDPDGLQVGQPLPSGLVVCMAHVVANLFALTAYLTNPCHQCLR